MGTPETHSASTCIKITSRRFWTKNVQPWIARMHILIRTIVRIRVAATYVYVQMHACTGTDFYLLYIEGYMRLLTNSRDYGQQARTRSAVLLVTTARSLNRYVQCNAFHQQTLETQKIQNQLAFAHPLTLCVFPIHCASPLVWAAVPHIMCSS